MSRLFVSLRALLCHETINFDFLCASGGLYACSVLSLFKPRLAQHLPCSTTFASAVSLNLSTFVVSSKYRFYRLQFFFGSQLCFSLLLLISLFLVPQCVIIVCRLRQFACEKLGNVRNFPRAARQTASIAGTLTVSNVITRVLKGYILNPATARLPLFPVRLFKLKIWFI